jgi:hypothetical protein
MNERYKRLAVAGVAGVSISASLAACGGSDSRDGAAPAQTSTAAPRNSAQTESGYRDGRYRARGWYGSLPSAASPRST